MFVDIEREADGEKKKERLKPEEEIYTLMYRKLSAAKRMCVCISLGSTLDGG